MEIIEEQPNLKSKGLRLELKRLEKDTGRKSLQYGPQLEFPQQRKTKVKRLDRPSKFKRKF